MKNIKWLVIGSIICLIAGLLIGFLGYRNISLNKNHEMVNIGESDIGIIVQDIEEDMSEIEKLIQLPTIPISDTTYVVGDTVCVVEKTEENVSENNNGQIVKRTNGGRPKSHDNYPWDTKRKIRNSIIKVKENINKIKAIGKIGKEQKNNMFSPATIVHPARNLRLCIYPVIGMGYSGNYDGTLKDTGLDPYIGLKVIEWRRYGINIGSSLRSMNVGLSRKIDDLIPFFRNTGIMGAYGLDYGGGERMFVGITVEL